MTTCKWHKYPEDKPKVRGDYLCATYMMSRYLELQIVYWNVEGESWNDYTFGWGLKIDELVAYWTELPEIPEEYRSAK